MSSKLDMTPSMTINEVCDFLVAVGDQLTTVIQSEPGCGKSSLLGMVAEKMGDSWRSPSDNTYYPQDKYDYIYVDCPVKDMQDIGMVIPNHQTQSLEYYVSSLFKLSGPSANRPKVIMLDEMMKAPKLLQVIFTRLMLERMVGDKALPNGSVLFATSNNESDGVGDTMLAHAGNRVVKIRMSKPNVPTWLSWAKKNAIHRIVCAFVAMYPRSLASYLDKDQEDNPYIFKPNGPKTFCSPRSLAKCSVIIERRNLISENALHAGIAGTIGAAAAADMAAFISVESSVVDAKDIIKNPDMPVPEQVAAQLLIMFQAVDVIETQDDMSRFMRFVTRIPSEMVQSIFYTMAMRGKLVKLAIHNEHIKKWLEANRDIVV